MEEVWKPVPGYEGVYEVSDMGRVRRLPSGRLLTPYRNNFGYLQVSLSHSGRKKKLQVHRLVLAAHTAPAGPSAPYVNHIDGVKTNNSLANLEWVSHRDNMLHSLRVLRSRAGYRRAVRAVHPDGTVSFHESISAAARALGMGYNRTWGRACRRVTDGGVQLEYV